jgi:ribonucleoside-diphosphate reductase alpha chain
METNSMTAAGPITASDETTRPFFYQLPAGSKLGTTLSITIDDSRDALLTDFGRATLRDRYLLPGESFQDMFARVACANSDEVIRGEASGHAQRVYDYISRLWFMPATPVLTNSGTERGLPISCFLSRVGDSMDSIAEHTTETIWLAAKGGGIGSSWSDVRSIGEPIAGSLTGSTSGIVPFIKWQDAQTLAISQGSLRRGSAAVYLDISHPEIEEFVDIRRPTGGDPRRKAHNIHHGVMVSDKFMARAFENEAENRQWDLVSPKSGEVIKTVDARELLIKLLVTRLETGEPYIVFSDTVNRQLPEIYDALGLKCVQSNLCSEITLHTGKDHLGAWRTAVCCLSSLNWETADQWQGNKQFLKDFMSFLDNVLQIFIDRAGKMKGFERAVYAAIRERSVGGGVMGFHSYLQSKELPYEGKHAQAINKRLWTWLDETADEINEELADERGECPDSADARAIDPSIRRKRLTHVFSVAPTASISIICGGASPCDEPWPANSFTQKTLSGSFNVRNPYLDAQLRRRYHQLRESLEAMNKTVRFLLKEEPMFKGVVEQTEEEWLEDQWSSITINDGSVQHLPYLCHLEKATFRTAFEIDQRWRVIHAADRAPMVCQAQSVNLFLRADVHKKDLVAVHRLAWELGLKSLYYVRSRTVSKAMAVSHVAGEMPSPKLEAPGVESWAALPATERDYLALKAEAPAGPVYVDEPTCESCQ